jgi:Rieske Fe-S protein
VADVPVGGGLVVATRQVVLTQPVEGEVKAFSAVCPHQGCLVTEVRDGEIICPCHGSRFAVDTGDVVSGPAGRGLEERQVTVTDDGITVS